MRCEGAQHSPFVAAPRRTRPARSASFRPAGRWDSERSSRFMRRPNAAGSSASGDLHTVYNKSDSAGPMAATQGWYPQKTGGISLFTGRQAVSSRLISALVVALCLAGCATRQTLQSVPQSHTAGIPAHQAAAPLDWFHRQLAAARHARITHLPVGDTAGAQRAYYSVMIPVCGQVAKGGPDKYRARCRAIIYQATTNAAAAAAGPPCADDKDDSGESPAQITACSD
jgi:hypothetical protein